MKCFALRVIQWAGIVTHYGLDAPGIESWGGRDYPRARRWALWPTQHPRQRVLGLFPGVKRPGHVVDPTSSNSKVKERVELYFYSWAFVACCTLNLPFTVGNPSCSEDKSTHDLCLGFVQQFNLSHSDELHTAT